MSFLPPKDLRRKFYKYCSVVEQNGIIYSLQNIQNNSIYFQSPVNFNDPFDSTCKVLPIDRQTWERYVRLLIEADYQDQLYARGPLRRCLW